MKSDVKDSAAIILKLCPFCGGYAKHETVSDRGSGDGYVLPFESHRVRCIICQAQTMSLRQKPLVEFTSYTYADFRGNPILRAQVEEEYEQYIETLKLNVAESWNRRRLV